MAPDTQGPEAADGTRGAGEVQRLDVLGVGLTPVELPRAVEVIGGWIDAGRREYVCAVDVNSLMHAYRDPRICEVLEGAGLATADGAPLYWAGKYAGYPECGRTAGPRLMPALCTEAARRGWRVLFLGGEEGVPEKVADAMREIAPGLEVVGTISPPFRPLTDEEDAELVATINAARPDIVWVAFGAPRQELWMAAHRDRLDAAVLIGVGAAFAIHAGLVSEAPAWIQPTGLEWVYRISREPRRLVGRYARSHPAFVSAVVRRPPQLRPAPPGTL